MARSFVERWFVEDAPCDVFWDDERARFEVVSGERVVFEAPALVEVLRWGMGVPAPDAASGDATSVHDDSRAIDLSFSEALDTLITDKV